jgi:hypothetical protein
LRSKKIEAESPVSGLWIAFGNPQAGNAPKLPEKIVNVKLPCVQQYRPAMRLLGIAVSAQGLLLRFRNLLCTFAWLQKFCPLWKNRERGDLYS